MRKSEPHISGGYSTALARRALSITLTAAGLGALLGLIGTLLGTVVGQESKLIFCSLMFSSGALITLIFFAGLRYKRSPLYRRLPFQSIFAPE
jgi:hypothetical protein